MSPTLDATQAATPRQRIHSEQSAHRHALIEQRLRRSPASFGPTAPIPYRPDRERAPLSSGQRRMWFMTQLLPGSPLYNTPVVLRLEGELHVPVLLGAFDHIVQRHEILRTRFAADSGAPVQIVVPARPVPFRELDLSAFAPADRESELKQALLQESARPFDLSQDLMIRATLIRMGPFDHVLTVVVHQIAFDVGSWEILFNELGLLYDAQLNHTEAQLPPLPIQYADYAAWERDAAGSADQLKALAYWKAKLAEAPELLELPLDHPRPTAMRFKGATLRLPLSRELGASLRSVSRREGATLFMTLLAAFQVLLNRLTDQTDLVVGIPAGGRASGQTEHLIGQFVNPLALRADLAGDPAFPVVLQRVKRETTESLRNQAVSFDRLLEEMRPARDPSHLPWMQVMFSCQNALNLNVRIAGVSARPIPVDPGTARFDLTLLVEESGLDLEAVLEFNRDLFESETARRMLERYRSILEEIAQNPDRPLSSLAVLPAAERSQLLVAWNQTARAFAGPERLHELFEAQARASPLDEALVAGSQRFSYGRLNRRADLIASLLRAMGIGPECRVAVFLPRTADLVVALLAVLKTGAAYVALDPAYPAERLAYIVQDCGAEAVLTQTSLLPALPASVAQTLCLDAEVTAAKLRANRALRKSGKTLTPIKSGGRDLAYIIYTSGSTGRPKGVALEHHSAVSFVRWACEVYGTGELAGVLAGTSICFDLSIFEIFAPLSCGGKIILAENALALPSLAARSEVRLINTVPSIMEELLRLGGIPATVETVNLAGEPLPTHVVQKLYALPHVKKVYDLYGPTETTTYSTFALRDPSGRGTIGRPLANTQLYLLDARHEPVPIGVTAELYIGGEGVARGYLNQPDLTAARFLRNPFSHDSGARMYRTGDLCRYRPDGQLEYVGRVDQQVKIRGFRIEPGEIEAVLLTHPLIEETVVTAQNDPVGGKRLVAYAVPKPGATLDWGSLRAFLEQKVPRALIPSRFVALPAIPHTATGKIDRRALPAPDESGPAAGGTERIAPRCPLEARLVAVWESVLNVKPIGVTDRFFDLGGHSLLAVRLVAQIEMTFGRKLPLAAIFGAPTVEQLARLLESTATPEASASLLALHPQGTRPPLYLVHGIGGGMMWGYANLSRHLGSDQPVYAFRAAESKSPEAEDSVEAMAERYVADLRRFQPQGPYHLGGYCFGGVVAYEMARQLEARGQSVALLVLFNSWPPQFERRKLPRSVRSLGAFFLNLANRLAHFRHRGGGGPRAESKLWQAHLRAMSRYRPQPWGGRVVLLRTKDYPVFSSFDRTFGWNSLARGGVSVSIVPGCHQTVMIEPNICRVARELRTHLSALPG